ncbi:uncharacterized protein DUF4124 [Luteibacter sp. OK325]|nr:uncharacterized protein DUF4124 [Luteibacter sp. OK325]
MRMPSLAVVAVLALAVLAPAYAQSNGTYYRWKDASGVTHYGDAPPAGGRSTPVKVKGSVTSSAGAPVQPAAPVSSASMAAQAAAAAPSGMAAAEQAARSRNCDNAKANLKTLSGNALLVDSSDPSSAKRMTPEQLETAQRVANIDVTENCPKGAP